MFYYVSFCTICSVFLSSELIIMWKKCRYFIIIHLIFVQQPNELKKSSSSVWAAGMELSKRPGENNTCQVWRSVAAGYFPHLSQRCVWPQRSACVKTKARSGPKYYHLYTPTGPRPDPLNCSSCSLLGWQQMPNKWAEHRERQVLAPR